MWNTASVIQNHNNNLLKIPAAPTAKECSCPKNSNRPVTKNCLSKSLVYSAQVDMSGINQINNFYGTCNKNFKLRYNNNKASYRNKRTKKVQNPQNLSDS